ncbi:4'-phosphopantetheinyl transferase superfamily protein [Myroides sp. N17-2]|uniref:4'-phosphopantetheinyl transferase family protein n=1 Tax=Myroides sp. N17-2 TaxID=2030799 RepID=UPI000EFA4A41|nr:4'-phosphopantetheinyl transferase superfamily protein [Myroides sp. N17-2]
MPLVKEIVEVNIKVLVWKVEETFEELIQDVSMRPQTKERLEGMKSEVHQKGFIAVRQLLQYAGYSDLDLRYDENGKPSLIDGSYISISHSFEYASIIIGKENVGIDIEMKRDKIRRIASKFCNDSELALVDGADDEVDMLTEIWCTKEAMFKMCESRSLSFKNHMLVNLAEKEAVVDNGVYKQVFTYSLVDFNNFTLVYAVELN